ncbi:hypothetical protein LguiA_011018 [Lonicera macranthoides]
MATDLSFLASVPCLGNPGRTHAAVATHSQLHLPCYKILSNNRRTGVLPKIIGVRLPNHNSLDLSFNSVHGNYRDDLSYNYFVGPLPVLPANVSILNLYNNKLSGTLWSLCLVNNVYDTLDMSHNLFTGEIPDCLRQWKYSINLNFAHNKLTDRIPS